MATEGTLWDWLKRARDHFGAALDMRRVENAVSTGDPDVDGTLSGRSFWMELKSCARPAKVSTRLRYHEVTTDQVEWHKSKQAAGGATCFLVQVGSGPEAARYLVHGRLAHHLRDGVTEQWLKTNGLLVGKAINAVREACNFTSAFEY